MTVPSASSMKKKAIGFYGMSLGKEAEEYLEKLFSAVESGWKSWQDSIKWGTLKVNGAGFPAWSGSGTGGAMQGQPFTMRPFSFKANSPEQVKFTKGLIDTLGVKFTAFPATYKFTAVQYAGTTGATDKNPGPVNAPCIPLTLQTAGKGQPPSGIAALWRSFLTPPDFFLDNPQAKSGQLVDAISKSIEQSFQTVWLASTFAQGNILSGKASPGGVVAGLSSGFDGKLG